LGEAGIPLSFAFGNNNREIETMSNKNRFGGAAVEERTESVTPDPTVEGNFVFTLHKTDHVTEREFEEWLEDN